MGSTDKSAVKVVFGAMTFGRAGWITSRMWFFSYIVTDDYSGGQQSRVHDLKTAGDILDIVTKYGHNEIDTARAYGEGTSETMLGDLDWQKRGLIVETKLHVTRGREVPEGWDADICHTPEKLREYLMKSLKELKTDKLEMYYLHQPDRSTPYEVTLKAVNDLYKEGYFKRLGISNYQAWEVAQMCELCRANGWKQPEVYQGVYNALHRSVEQELFACLRHYGIAFYAYNPLAGGYLTDRYHREDKDKEIESGARFDPNRWQGKMYRARYWRDEYFDALDLLRPVAKKHGLTEAECAIRWMNHHSMLKREHGDASIIGASSTKHLEENLVDFEKGPLPEDLVEALDKGWEGCKGISIRPGQADGNEARNSTISSLFILSQYMYGTMKGSDEQGNAGKHTNISVEPEWSPSPARRHENTDLLTTNEDRDLTRGLHQRHISLIAIAGSIGTGLFLGLGSSIQTAGPAGALLAYATIGLIVCAVQFALGEVTALLPVTGSFVRHAEFLVDPAMGFAVGWNIVYGNWLSIPAEISAICVLFQFWLPDLTPAVWIIITILLTFVVGMALVRIYGEVEFWFALLKIVFIIFLIILGLVINLGGVPGVPRKGFQYWHKPGAFVEYIGTGDWGHFLGYWAVMSAAVFSFAGTESLAMAAAETRNPRQAIPAACKRVFWRVLVFYVLAVLVVGMLVPSTDKRLNSWSGTATQSPFVIAAGDAGLTAIPSVVNAIVITSAWSSSNQALLSGTRVLYSLALKGQAPKVFLRTTSWGIPYVCVIVQTLFMFLAFMSLSSGALTVFWWFVDLTACGVLISWISILINHQRLIMAMKAQNIPLSSLPWHNNWTRYSTPAALCLSVIILLTGGYQVFTKGNWSTSSFVSSYLDIPLVLLAFGLWKVFNKTKIVKLLDIPLREALDDYLEHPEEKDPASKGWRKIFGFLWD